MLHCDCSKTASICMSIWAANKGPGMRGTGGEGEYVGLLIPPEHQGCKEEGKQDNSSQHNASDEQLALGAVVRLTLGPCCPCAHLVRLQNQCQVAI